MADSLLALRAHLEKRDDLLALPVDQVGAMMPDAEVAHLLGYLAEHVDATTLDALLKSPEANRLVEQGIRPDSRQAVLDALGRWARHPNLLRWRWRPTGGVEVESPPHAKAALKKWAKKHDVDAWLGAPAKHVRPFAKVGLFIEGDEAHVTLDDLLEGRGPVARISPSLAQGYADAARTFLWYRAVRAAAKARRDAQWQERPRETGLRALAVRLHDLHRTLDPEATEAPVFLTPEDEVAIEADPPATAMTFYKGGRPTTARLELAGYEDGAVTARGDGPLAEKVSASPHVRALLEWTLDAVHDPKHPLHATLAHVLRQPTWSRFVDALAASIAQKAAPVREERLVWRVEDAVDDLPDVVPAVQKRLKSGRWSSGAQTEVDKLDPALVKEADEPIVDALLALGERIGAAAARRRRERALRALVGHPRVFRGKAKIGVREVTPTLALVPEGEGVRVEVRVEEAPIDPATIAGEAQTLAVLDERELLLAEIDARVARVAEALSRFPAVLPKEAHDRLLVLLPRLQPAVRLALPSPLRGDARPPDPTLIARLEPDDESLSVRFQVRPLPDGPTWPAGRGPALTFGVAEGERAHAHRELDDERRRARALREELGLWGEHEVVRLEGLERALDVLAALEAKAEAEELAIEWPAGKSWRQLGAAQAADLKVRVKRAGEWFGVSGEVEVGGARVPLAALLDAAREGKKYVRVGPGRFAAIEDDLRKRLTKAEDALFEEDGELAAGLASLEEVRELAGEELEGDDGWLEVLERMRAAASFAPTLPTGLKADLRSYQEDGFAWMARLASWGAGACLADEMGLGKTVQALAMLLHRAEEGPALVVAPTSVGAGWMQEAERFAPELEVRSYRGPRREKLLEELGPKVVLVTSYDILARNPEELEGVDFATVIFDEAQAMKNARTRRAKAARRLQARWRLALTGTPLENHLGELWSLFRIVSPGLLGTWPHFKRRFALPIERDGDEERRLALARKLRPFLLRRTKKEVAPELPPRTEVVRPVEMSEAERRIYEAARGEALESLAGAGERFDVLAAMTRLRLLACHPRLVDPTTTVKSAKLEAFLELVDELREDGHRALVFSQFTSLLGLVRDALDLRGVDSLYLDGSTPAKKRPGLVQEWQEGDAPLFLISLKAGGTGLNLTGADTVVHLDPWWNPAVEDQASDRTHRIGQKKPVTVVRLVTQDTIEETVLALHGDKRALFEGVFEGAGKAAKLSTQELVDLIRGGGEDAGESEGAGGAGSAS
ncbi:MAG: hypothetical protein CMN29_19290 [Sandaracinus sp.]|nr:hypothetical protein [Sandaracinus sp.]